MKKSLFIVLLLTLVLTGCGDSKEAKPAATSGDIVVKDNRTSNVASIEVKDMEEPQVVETVEINDSDFSDKGYLYENSIGDSLYFVVVTNNGKASVSVSGNGTAKDSSDNVIGAGDFSIDVLGPGETSIGYFYFDSVSGIEKVDYQLSYSESRYYYPVIGNLSVEQNLNNENLTVTVTNNGKTIASFVEAYALFFDADNNVIRYASNYVTDNDSEIKPGATLSSQLDCYEGYDHVELYLRGRSDGKEADGAAVVTGSGSVTDSLETTEYMFENSIGDSLYFVVVKNTSSEACSVGGNGTAKDSSGNTIGAANFSIDVIGPGETSIGYFYFDSVSGIANVDYSLSAGESYYSPVINDLSVEQNINNQNVVVSVTNNGTEAAEFVEAYALFFDANNSVVKYSSTYLTDNDSEIKPGATISGQLDAYESFDHVEVYLTGRRY